MSQVSDIIKWLTPPGRTLTPLQALAKFNCWSLSSRASDIKKMKLPIKSKLFYDKKTKKQYAKYFFE